MNRLQWRGRAEDEEPSRCSDPGRHGVRKLASPWVRSHTLSKPIPLPGRWKVRADGREHGPGPSCPSGSEAGLQELSSPHTEGRAGGPCTAVRHKDSAIRSIWASNPSFSITYSSGLGELMGFLSFFIYKTVMTRQPDPPGCCQGSLN